MKVFAAMYCPCTYESDFGVISLHMSETGARTAVDRHRRKEVKRWGKINDWQKYEVKEMEVKP